MSRHDASSPIYVEQIPVCVCSIQYMGPMHLMSNQGVISQDWHMLGIWHLFYTYEGFFWQFQVIGLLLLLLAMWMFHLRSDVSITSRYFAHPSVSRRRYSFYMWSLEILTAIGGHSCWYTSVRWISTVSFPTIVRSCWRSSQSWNDLMVRYSRLSSANNLSSHVTFSVMSLMYIKNSSGPSMYLVAHLMTLGLIVMIHHWRQHVVGDLQES